MVREKQYCENEVFDNRKDPWQEGKALFRCTSCGRVARTPRRHQLPGPTTASHDKTMASAWNSAGRR